MALTKITFSSSFSYLKQYHYISLPIFKLNLQTHIHVTTFQANHTFYFTQLHGQSLVSLYFSFS